MKLLVVAKILQEVLALHGILAPSTSFIPRWTSKNQILILKTFNNYTSVNALHLKKYLYITVEMNMDGM